MLSKITGPSLSFTTSGTALTLVPFNFDGSIPKVVRIAAAVDSIICFNTTATTSTGILIPGGTAEHFKLEHTSVLVSTGTSTTIPSNIATYSITATISLLQGSAIGLVSITPVA